MLLEPLDFTLIYILQSIQYFYWTIIILILGVVDWLIPFPPEMLTIHS